MLNTPEHDSRGLTLTGAQYLTITAAAKYAGLSRSTVYRMIQDGSLTVYTPTKGTRRISKAQLIERVERPAC